jgi:hypothetical protein
VNVAIFGLLSAIPMIAVAKPLYDGLPDDAVRLEEEVLPPWAHAHRAFAVGIGFKR